MLFLSKRQKQELIIKKIQKQFDILKNKWLNLRDQNQFFVSTKED